MGVVLCGFVVTVMFVMGERVMGDVEALSISGSVCKKHQFYCIFEQLLLSPTFCTMKVCLYLVYLSSYKLLKFLLVCP